MAAFMKLGDIDGEATDNEHKDWIIIESMSSSVTRSFDDAEGTTRSRGDTTLGDVVVVRELDKASVKLQQACAHGTVFAEAQLDFTTQTGGRQATYLTHKLKNVIVTSYSMSADGAGDTRPTEQVTLGYTEGEWTYVAIDPATGDAGERVTGRSGG